MALRACTQIWRGLMNCANPEGPMRHEQFGPALLRLLLLRGEHGGVQQWLISDASR
jgi:hypothetical protein